MPGGLTPRARQIAEAARAAGRDRLTEPEALALIRELGIGVPEHCTVGSAADARQLSLDRFSGDRLVLKVVSEQIPHKTEMGGVEVVPKQSEALAEAVDAMGRRVSERAPGAKVDSFLVAEVVAGASAPESELLVGVSWSRDFGPLVTIGPGGVRSEQLAGLLEGGRAALIASPALEVEDRGRLLERKRYLSTLVTAHRGRRAVMERAALEHLIDRVFEIARHVLPAPIRELEINPLVSTERGPMALDALVRLGDPPRAPSREHPHRRPVDAIRPLLEPRSVALVGVSRGQNPGRIMLRRMLSAGFEHPIYVVKAGVESIEGCPAVAGIDSLPEPVDLLILSVAAGDAVELLERVAHLGTARAVVLIPGGFDERSGAESLGLRAREAIARSRTRGRRGLVVQGGNCLGVFSAPGRLDALFIPEHKLDLRWADERRSTTSGLALLSQSGAFAIARASKLDGVAPRYLISVGNQIDLTVGDFLSALVEDAEVRVAACYVEGFAPLDGQRFLRAARAMRARGGTVILYRAGRTSAGVSAAASHTAAIAGSYAVTRELAAQSGVLVAETVDQFDDLTRLACRLADRPIRGPRVGAVSNAGFECVSIADSLAPLELAKLAEVTENRLAALLEERRLAGVVGVRNPLDLTPMLDDPAYELAVRAVLEDPNVDVGLVACVPLTGALETLPGSAAWQEDVERDDSVAHRLGRLFESGSKPWVAVVDSGVAYDPMVRVLERHGVPTFRSADRAARMLAAFALSS